MRFFSVLAICFYATFSSFAWGEIVTENLLEKKLGLDPGQEPDDNEKLAETLQQDQKFTAIDEKEDLLDVQNENVSQPEQQASPLLLIKLGALDKITGRLSVVEARVGEPATFERLTITPRFCEKAPPEDTPEVKVFLEITEKPTRGADKEQTVYSNWMFASAPSACAMEHPIYDIWVIGADFMK